MARKKPLFSFPEKYYTPIGYSAAVEAGILSPKMISKELKRLRDIARKRVTRLIDAGFSEVEAVGQMKRAIKLKGGEGLQELARLLRHERTRVPYQRTQAEKVKRYMKSIGIIIHDVNKFYRYMEKFRQWAKSHFVKGSDDYAEAFQYFEAMGGRMEEEEFFAHCFWWNRHGREVLENIAPSAVPEGTTTEDIMLMLREAKGGE